MRVTLLSKALVVGAYQRKCELLAAHPDIELTVLVPPAWGNQPLERAHMDGYDLRVLPIRFNGNFHLHHYPTLRHELACAKPDIFHVDEEPYNLATWLALRAVGALTGAAKAKSSRQALRPLTHTLFFSWQNINRQYPPPFSWMEHDVLRRADAAIVGSEAARQVWRAKGFSREISVIPQFGVDEHLFSPSPQRGGTSSRSGEESWGEGASFNVGYAGRFVPEKGLDLLLRAVAQLPANARLILARSGEEETTLRALAQQLGIAGRIEFRAPIPSTDMPAFYRELDAFVLPSRARPNWKEQFGRVLIEAMACDVPVVGARSGEIPNIVGDAGLLFDEGDADGLHDCLIQLMRAPDLRAALAAKGRARVLDMFTMQRIADQTVEVYCRLTHV
jgi:glycosyltransferase involved in cell wall biosynthesis